MKKKIQILSLKLVISFSFILIFSGMYLVIEKKSYKITSLEDVVIVTKEDNNDDIAINKTDQEPSTKDETTKEPTIVVPPIENNKVPIPTVPETNKPTTQLPTIEQDNIKLKEQIEKKYGIKIKYGKEIGNYTVSGLDIIAQTDPNEINKALKEIEYELTLYPEGFIKETTDIGLKLNLFIIKKYSQEYVTGITDSRNINIIISLATDYSIKDTIHHEIFHYIENYLLNVDGKFTSWETLNPNDFIYDHKNENYTCNINSPNDAKFVNDYAQTNAYEDRASTFEYMMKDNKSSCLINSNVVGIKANYIANQLDQFFESVSPNKIEHWERFIK